MTDQSGKGAAAPPKLEVVTPVSAASLRILQGAMQDQAARISNMENRTEQAINQILARLNQLAVQSTPPPAPQPAPVAPALGTNPVLAGIPALPLAPEPNLVNPRPYEGDFVRGFWYKLN